MTQNTTEPKTTDTDDFKAPRQIALRHLVNMERETIQANMQNLIAWRTTGNKFDETKKNEWLERMTGARQAYENGVLQLKHLRAIMEEIETKKLVV